MQHTLLALAAGLTFAAAAHPSFAQPYSQGGGDSAQYGRQNEQSPPPADPEGLDGRWRHERRGGYAQNENGPPGPGLGGPPPPPHRPPPPPPAAAAHFVFQRGGARIDITCPQTFALQDCVQAAGELLDKIHALRGGAPRADAGGGVPVPGVQGAPGGSASPPSPSGGGQRPPGVPSVTPQLLVPNPDEENQM